MKFTTNKEKGNTGLGIAIAYFSSHGYTVSIPLNDTQDYDLIVDNTHQLLKIQVKASGQLSRYDIPKVNLRSLGGTKGTVYKRIKNIEIDFVFILHKNMQMWLIPKSVITQGNELTLNKQFDKYKVSLS